AAAWNDLAAARYTMAEIGDEPAWLPAALVAADHALRLAPSLASAHFNRALILTRAGLRFEGKREWKATLAAENDVRWKAEARSRLQLVDAERAPLLQVELEAALNDARSGRGDVLQGVIRRRVEEIRATGETILVSSWADAAAQGDTQRADRQLWEL